LEKVYGGVNAVEVFDRLLGGLEELERYVEQLAVKSGMRDMTVALSATMRKTTVEGELDAEGKVA